MTTINGYDFYFDRARSAARLWLFFYFMGLAMFDEMDDPIAYSEFNLFYLPVEFYA